MKRLVNNVVFVIDESGSMHHHKNAVTSVVRDLATSLKNSAQEALVSLYTFNTSVNRQLLTDDPKKLSDFSFYPNGQTALIDAAMRAIKEHQILRVPANEDHSFLLYVITDGEENCSREYSSMDLRRKLQDLDDSWTVAALVPNNSGVHYAKQVGFAAGNIEVWNATDEKGFEDVGNRISDTYSNYTSIRSGGGLGTRTLFVDANKVTVNKAEAQLSVDNNWLQFVSKHVGGIRNIVEAETGTTYVAGSAFYELTKAETVQAKKEIVIINRTSGNRYVGDNARIMLNIPVGSVKIRPGDLGEWRIFVQSTSVNRKVYVGDTILVR